MIIYTDYSWLEHRGTISLESFSYFFSQLMNDKNIDSQSEKNNYFFWSKYILNKF